MRGDRLHTDGGYVIDCRREAIGARDMGRSGFEPAGNIGEFGFIEGDTSNHVTAALIGRHGGKNIRLAIQNADAARPV